MMDKKSMIELMNLIHEGMLVTAMAVESVGRLKRIVSKNPKADKGLVLGTQLLYSLAYGVKDFKEKLDGTKYRKR